MAVQRTGPPRVKLRSPRKYCISPSLPTAPHSRVVRSPSSRIRRSNGKLRGRFASVSNVSAIVHPIACTFLESGMRAGLLAGLVLLAACGTHESRVATIVTPAADRLTPTVVSVSPGATIAWGFSVAAGSAFDFSSHDRYADSRMRTR